MVTQYELLYIIPATFTDDDLGGIETKVKALLEKYGANIEITNRLGKFKLAYPIKGVRHGHYMLVRFSSEGTLVAKLDEALRISSEVLRHLILRADEVGGEKFDLIQFTEVNLDAKEEEKQRRRREEQGKTEERKSDIKTGVAVLEGQDEVAAEVAPVEIKSQLTAEELEKKIDSVLQDNS